MTKSIPMTAQISRVVSSVGAVGGVVADTIDTVGELGSSIKNGLLKEVSSLQTERDIENAVARIKAKAKAAQELAATLNIEPQLALELLEQELSNK